jgi:hypothetical protein
MRNKNYRLVAEGLYDKSNPFMNGAKKEEKPAKGLVKKDVEVEEYPESMKIKYENVMPSGWL